jgi:hypothetical protein
MHIDPLAEIRTLEVPIDSVEGARLAAPIATR